MRFELEGTQRPPAPTVIRLHLDADGDVAVKADDVTLLWLRTSGKILLSEGAHELRRLGFSVDADTDAVELA